VKHNENEESDDLLNSSSDEVTAVFKENGTENYQLRLAELTPVSFRGVESKKTSADSVAPAVIGNRRPGYPASDSSNFYDFDDRIDEIDAGENVKNSTFLTRRDSRNNMLNNTDTDDDLIVV
jgi:hypothetical protein